MPIRENYPIVSVKTFVFIMGYPERNRRTPLFPASGHQKFFPLTKIKKSFILAQMAVETGQFYFRPNPAGTAFEVSSTLTEPEPTQFPDFTSRAIELERFIQGINARTSEVYDMIVGRWFASKFGPPEYLRLTYQEFLRPNPGYWEKQLYQAPSWPGDFDTLNKKIIERVMGIRKTRSSDAVSSIENTFRVFEDIAWDLYGIRSENILLTNFNFSERFRQQLALAGIFTQTQFNLLSLEQRLQISRIKVPKACREMHGFELRHLITLLSEFDKLPRTAFPQR